MWYDSKGGIYGVKFLLKQCGMTPTGAYMELNVYDMTPMGKEYMELNVCVMGKIMNVGVYFPYFLRK